MSQSLKLLTTATLLAAAASAQCFSATGTSIVPLMSPTSTWSVDDEGRSSAILLPFSFPIGGSSYDYIAVHSNGEIYFTDNTGVPVLPVNYGITYVGALTQGSPRICAFGDDLEALPAGGWDIKVDDTVGGEVKISWEHVHYYASSGADDFSMSITLYAGGAVRFDYSNGNWDNGAMYSLAGIGGGNNIGSTAPSSDINFAGSSGNVGSVYQTAFAPWDLDNQGILFVPNVSGGYDWVVACGTPPNPPAYTEAYGQGCYDTSTYQSVYAYFVDATASQVLGGQSFTFIPGGTNYTMIAGGAPFVAPTGAAVDLLLTDDSEIAVTPSLPFNYLGTTPIATLSVNSNGFVNMAGTGVNYIYCYGSTYELLNANAPSFRANADYNPGATGSGHVYSEEIGGVLYVTWSGVYRYGNTTPETMQIQLDLASGMVTIVFGTMATTGYGLVVGYAPTGPCLDSGGINLATDLPVTTGVDLLAPAMALSADPAPVSTGTTGTTVTIQVDYSPEVVPGSGFVADLLIFSFSQNPGLDMTFLGAPGCFLYVSSLDLTLAIVGPAGPQTMAFNVPPGVSALTEVFVQAAALAPVNAFGVATSNGVKLFISDN